MAAKTERRRVRSGPVWKPLSAQARSAHPALRGW